MANATVEILFNRKEEERLAKDEAHYIRTINGIHLLPHSQLQKLIKVTRLESVAFLAVDNLGGGS
jgi:hypothetical protein